MNLYALVLAVVCLAALATTVGLPVLWAVPLTVAAPLAFMAGLGGVVALVYVQRREIG